MRWSIYFMPSLQLLLSQMFMYSSLFWQTSGKCIETTLRQNLSQNPNTEGFWRSSHWRTYKNKPRTETETIPFVITYNPALPNIAHIIHQHSNVLYSSDRCRNVFKNLPLVAYRRCKNISDILVRAQLTEDPDSSNSRVNPGSFPVPGSLYHLSLHRTWPHSIYFLFHRWNVPYQISYNLYYFQCYLHDSMSPM